MLRPELKKGILFDIQGFSVHDGPGCRTLIFFKGCSLHCKWCSNPEGLNIFPEPLYNNSKCLFDNLCIHACPGNAIKVTGNELQFDRLVCEVCLNYECRNACCSGALNIGGYSIGIDELFETIGRDRQFWGNHGGITLTGGEPFRQPDFAKDILKRCYNSYIHTTVETCGNVRWNNIEPSLEYLDWIFYDLKHIDPVMHRAMTGAGNELILENARRISNVFEGRFIFRMPVIPGFNDDENTILQLSRFLNSIGKHEINILPVHHLGRDKYKLTGNNYYTSDYAVPSQESLRAIQIFFESDGIHCYIGSETPF